MLSAASSLHTKALNSLGNFYTLAVFKQQTIYKYQYCIKRAAMIHLQYSLNYLKSITTPDKLGIRNRIPVLRWGGFIPSLSPTIPFPLPSPNYTLLHSQCHLSKMKYISPADVDFPVREPDLF
jgi:hypothetical protein